MSTKSITVTHEAYESLAAFKEANESFSEVIIKLTRRSSPLELVGLLTSSETDDLRDSVRELRSRLRKEVDKTAKVL